MQVHTARGQMVSATHTCLCCFRNTVKVWVAEGCAWWGPRPAWGPEDFCEELSTELKLEWTSQGGLVVGLG